MSSPPRRRKFQVDPPPTPCAHPRVPVVCCAVIRITFSHLPLQMANIMNHPYFSASRRGYTLFFGFEPLALQFRCSTLTNWASHRATGSILPKDLVLHFFQTFLVMCKISIYSHLDYPSTSVFCFN